MDILRIAMILKLLPVDSENDIERYLQEYMEQTKHLFRKEDITNIKEEVIRELKIEIKE